MKGNADALMSYKADYVRQPGYAVATNSGNAYFVSTNPAPTSYIDGMGIAVKINTASTGAATLNWNGLGAKPIYDSLGNAVTNLLANTTYSMKYESVNGRFIVQGKGGGGNATASDLRIGKTATVDTGQINGALADNGATGATLINQGQSYTIPSGITIGGTVTANISNLIASNILNTINVGGVVGTAKRVLSGQATASSTQGTFYKCDGSNFFTYFVNVSNLTFTPSKIFIYLVTPSSADYSTIYCSDGLTKYNSTICTILTAGGMTGYLGQSGYVNSTSFQLPVSVSGGLYKWIAIE